VDPATGAKDFSIDNECPGIGGCESGDSPVTTTLLQFQKPVIA